MGSEVSPIVALVIALVAVFVAWKLLKGLAKTVVLVGVLVLAAVYAFGGFN